MKAIGIDNAVKEQVNQNKENQQIPAQATVEATDKIVQLEKQQVRLYIYCVTGKTSTTTTKPDRIPLQQQSKH